VFAFLPWLRFMCPWTTYSCDASCLQHPVLTAIFPLSAVLQDTSGPSLNILMKLMAIISLVFADFFFAIK
jgi:hypothetical protein